MDLNVAYHVANAPAFTLLPEEDRRRLVSYSGLRGFSAGELLLSADTPAQEFLLLLTGSAVLGRSGEGKGQEICCTGDLIGFEAVLDGGTHAADARALTEGLALGVPAESFRDHLATRFDVMLGLLAATSARMRTTVHEITEIKLLSTTQRLASFLLGLARAQLGPAAGGPQRILLPCEKHMLAERLGMQPESLSRAFAKLRGVGVTTRRDQAVAIASLEELTRFCGDPDGTPQ